MKRFFRFRRRNRAVYAVTILVKTADGTVIDHGVIAPLTRQVAEQLSHHFSDAVSKNLGEELNAVGGNVEFGPKVMMGTDQDVAVWIADAARNLIEIGKPSRARQHLWAARAALEGREREMLQQFPWLKTGDEDGFIVDSTPWDRRPTGETFDQWRDEIRRRRMNEEG
jgi:hypothetical protein